GEPQVVAGRHDLVLVIGRLAELIPEVAADAHDAPDALQAMVDRLRLLVGLARLLVLPGRRGRGRLLLDFELRQPLPGLLEVRLGRPPRGLQGRDEAPSLRDPRLSSPPGSGAIVGTRPPPFHRPVDHAQGRGGPEHDPRRRPPPAGMLSHDVPSAFYGTD